MHNTEHTASGEAMETLPSRASNRSRGKHLLNAGLAALAAGFAASLMAAALMGVLRLEVTGLVGSPGTHTYEQLENLPSTSRAITLECISNGPGGRLISTAIWQGVAQRALCGILQCRWLYSQPSTGGSAQGRRLAGLADEWSHAAQSTWFPLACAGAGALW